MNKMFLAACCFAAVSCLSAAPQPIKEGEWDWKEATELGVRGRGFADAEPYARLPKRARGIVPQKVFRMARHSTGLYVDFTTDSDRIAVIWELADASGVDPQISPSGLYGVDVYAKAPGSDDWRFVSIGQVRSSKKGPLHSELTLKWTPGATGRVYLPMRGETSSLRIGVCKGCSLAAGPKQRVRVVHYGTSLVHGGCVDRAGMVFTSIYGRLADAEVVNLGFSGSAKLESEMVPFVAEPEADVYVVDPALNNSAAELMRKLPSFVRALAKLRTDKPILVCEPANMFMPETDRSLATRKVVDGLRAEGLNLQTIRTDELIAPDGEGTVDGIHPNAYGAVQMGRAFARKIITSVSGRK